MLPQLWQQGRRLNTDPRTQQQQGQRRKRRRLSLRLHVDLTARVLLCTKRRPAWARHRRASRDAGTWHGQGACRVARLASSRMIAAAVSCTQLRGAAESLLGAGRCVVWFMP